MTWNTEEIHEAYKAGDTGEYSHMIVAYDSFDYENYPIYVTHGADPRALRPSNGDRVDECYRYDLGWEAQSKERRANHWEIVERGSDAPRVPLT